MSNFLRNHHLDTPLLYSFFLLATIFVFGQDYNMVLPSPNSTSQVEGTNVPVNYYTGVATVSVPLYTIQADNGAQIPIGLQYNTTGIKVSQIASSAGLGWQLITGGAITRVMRDKPDENREFDGRATKAIVEDHMNGGKKYDHEKDMFYFSFPGGGGRMILGASPHVPTNCIPIGGGTPVNCDEFEMDDFSFNTTKIHTLPSSNMKIEFRKSGKLESYWIITDMSGNKYYFGESVNSREVTTSNSRELYGGFPSETELEFVSTWKLTRIEYANQPSDKQILFHYTKRTLVQDTESTRTEVAGSESNYNLLPWGKTKEYQSRSITNAAFVDRIEFPKGEVVFEYKDRLDHDKNLAINQILVNTKSGKNIQSFEFDHSYFSAFDSRYKNGKHGSCNRPECKRLKLNSITTRGRMYREFDYKNDKTFLSGVDVYELPPRDSYYHDHWGFFNGYGGQSDIYVARPELPGLEGMNREPKVSCLANILTKVKFPKGGYQEFSYDYNRKNGGARIDLITTKDEQGNSVSSLHYQYLDADENDSPSIEYVGIYPDGDDGDQTLYAHSQAIGLQYNLNGATAGYRKVEVKDLTRQESNRSIHHFYSEDDFEVALPQIINYVVSINLNGEYNDPLYQNIRNDAREYPFVTNSLEYYQLGLKKQTDILDSNKKLISRSYYDYEEVGINGGSPVYESGVFTLKRQYLLGLTVDVSRYRIIPKFMRLRSVKQQSWENDEMVSEVTTTNGYHSTYYSLPNVTETKKTDVYGRKYNSKQVVSYASDLGRTELINKRAIGIPVRTVNQINLPQYEDDEYRTSAVSETVFTPRDGWIYPSETKSLFIESPVESWDESQLETVSKTTYNGEGLLESVENQSGIIKTYLYDDNGYLIKEIINPGDSDLVRETTYDHEELVGVAEIVGSDGKKVSYEYDQHNRLYVTKDYDGRVLEKRLYNNAVDSEILTIDLSIEGTFKIGETVQFTISNPPALGKTKYYWSFGDGDFLETSELKVSHRYNELRRGTIKLTAFNENYPNKSVTKNINFHIVSESFSITGAPYSLCGGEIDYRFEGIMPGCTSSSGLIWQMKQVGSDIWVDMQIGGTTFTLQDARNRQGHIRVKLNGCGSDEAPVYSNERDFIQYYDSSCEQERGSGY